MQDLNARGITSATDAALGPGGTGFQGGFFDAECISVYNDLHNEGLLTVRMNLLYLFGSYGAISLKDFEKSIPEIGIHSGFGDEWLKIGGIKLFADGIPQTKTAWLHEDYPDGGNGSLVLPGATDQERCEELAQMIGFAHRHDFQCAIHAVGDRAIEACVDGFVRARERRSPRPAPLPGPLRPHHAGRHQAHRAAWGGREHAAHPQVGLLGLHRPGDRRRAVGVAVPAADAARRRGAREPLLGLAGERAGLAPGRGGGGAPEVEGFGDGPRTGAAHHRARSHPALHRWAAPGRTTWRSARARSEPGKLADFCVLDRASCRWSPTRSTPIKNVATVVGGRRVYEEGL